MAEWTADVRGVGGGRGRKNDLNGWMHMIAG